MENGIYFEVFAVMNGVRYNAKIISINDVAKILTTNLLDGLAGITDVKKEDNHESTGKTDRPVKTS